MSRFTPFLRLAVTCSLGAFASTLRAQDSSPEERFAATPDTLVAREDQAFHRVSLPIPDDIVLEVGGILAVPGQRLLVTTRRGEIWWVDGAYDETPNPRYTLFATGLHEILGIIAAPQGGYYIAQRQEITHVQDTDGDGRADVFDTVYKIPVAGNYHEYAFGPKLGADGHLRVTLNVSFGGGDQSRVPWRGWMLDIAPDGTMTPIAAGLRSPAGFMQTSQGAWIAAENQGEWVGSGRVTVIEPGDFIGHPASLAWTDLPGSTVKIHPDDMRNFEEPFSEVAKRMPGVKTPAVWFPHTILGISTSDIVEDTTGAFGPFRGQFFVGDQGQSKIMRMTMEKVKGVWQGASYLMHGGFDSGIVRLAWGEDGSLFAGSTNRGWGSVGPKPYALERMRYTGDVPFEIREVTATPDGFRVAFTTPVDPATGADPANYAVTGFNYLWHRQYGSAVVDRLTCPVVKVELAPDGLSARLAVACLREGYIHEVKAAGVRSPAGETLVHDNAFYTLNRIPDGDTMMPPSELRARAEMCLAAAGAPPAAPAASATRITDLPENWPDEEVTTITLHAQSGLKYDLTEIIVKPGARIALELVNDDDMLHNIVITQPGQGAAVGIAALSLGLEGDAKSYVPDLPSVIAHTRLLGPHEREVIYFTAPQQTGDYDYVCTFPGHYALMKGLLKVR